HNKIAEVRLDLARVEGNVLDVRDEARAGVAASIAMGPVFMPSAPGRTTIAATGSQWLDHTGVGLNIAHRLHTDTPIVLHGGVSNGGGDRYAGRVGVAAEF
ncbi:MAG TPA: hypothetical protein VEZ26_00035, partial [Sphingomonadaceae bacterium]|nr:hypothetical protein [Sphingomonadaceae bacterium]